MPFFRLCSHYASCASPLRHKNSARSTKTPHTHRVVLSPSGMPHRLDLLEATRLIERPIDQSATDRPNSRVRCDEFTYDPVIVTACSPIGNRSKFARRQRRHGNRHRMVPQLPKPTGLFAGMVNSLRKFRRNRTSSHAKSYLACGWSDTGAQSPLLTREFKLWTIRTTLG